MAGMFYAKAALGPKQTLLHNGALHIADVPIARIGDMIYGERELAESKIKGNKGVVRVSRTADTLFSQETVASFEGAPITIGHPPQFVNPQNWKQHARGSLVNVRPGTGEDADKLLADMVIMDDAAIKLVRGGLKEVSLGYTADYKQVADGEAEQFNIIGNHGAFVPAGRCGPSCAVGDEEYRDMSIFDRIRNAVRTNDEAGATAALAELEAQQRTADEAKREQETKDAQAALLTATTDAVVAKLQPTLDSIAAAVAAIKPGTPAVQTQDAATLLFQAEARDVLPRAEILAPGAVATFDASTVTADHVCQCKRSALAKAFTTDAGKQVISGMLFGAAPDFAALPATTIDRLFFAASEAMKAKNNSGFPLPKPATASTRDKSPETLDKRAKDYWNASKTPAI